MGADRSSRGVAVAPARDPADAARLRALFELYAYDFSEILPRDVGDDGRFAVPEPSVDAPFVLRVDGQLAGFALVNHRSKLSGAADVHDLAEFFVLRRYRRAGVGADAATQVFDRFPGRWEVRQRAENTAATAFWRRVIGAYTGGSFAESVIGAPWHGVVQRFVAPARSGL